MWKVSDDEFEQLVADAIDSLSDKNQQAIKNIAIIYQDDPTLLQREELKLRCDQTLFGLYEGVPLSKRQGQSKILPDKITIFKHPTEASAFDLASLKKQIRHTLWHEIAHYYGLDHESIAQIDLKN